MVDRKENMIEIICNVKEGIVEFNEKVQVQKKRLPDIVRIKKELTDIGKVIKDLDQLCKKEELKFEHLEIDTNLLQVEELKTNVELLIKVLLANLPDEMKCEIKDNNVEEGLYKNIQLKLNNEEGNLLIREKDEKFVVSVAVNNKEYYDFTVENPLRIYNIISYINIKFNYE